MVKKKFLLYGKNAVLERLHANPNTIKEILLIEGFQNTDVIKLIEKMKIPIRYIPRKKFLNYRYGERLQGIIARVRDFYYVPFEELLNKKLSLIFLDSLNDPHNLGVIIRTLACLGKFAVIIGEKFTCPVNETVLHVASGGENYVPVARIPSMPAALRLAKKSGFHLIGAVAKKGRNINMRKLPFPVALILGSESRGISKEISILLDERIKLPMEGASLSYNLAVACALLCYEIAKQR